MATNSSCPVCSKNVTKTSGVVYCSICEKWFHLKNCSELSDVAIEVLTKKKTDVCWKCKGCSSFVVVADNNNSALDNLTKKMDDLIKALPNTIRSEIDKSIPPILQTIEANKNQCEENHSAVVSELHSLKAENNRIRHQLARHDILVSGLPSTVKPSVMALKIPAALGVSLTESDIDCAFWLGRHKKILMLKFCSRNKRDEVMKMYMARKDLKLNALFPTDIAARVYLNDNLSPDALKLKKLCLSLLKEKKIKPFQLIPSAVQAVIYDINGKKKICCYDDLQSLDNDSESSFIRSKRGRRSDHSTRIPPVNDTPTFGTPTSARTSDK